MPQPPQKCECLVLNKEAKVCGELFQPSCVICDFQLPEEVSLSSGFLKKCIHLNALLRLLGNKKTKHGELKVNERRRLCGSNSNPLRLHPHCITTTFFIHCAFSLPIPSHYWPWFVCRVGEHSEAYDESTVKVLVSSRLHAWCSRLGRVGKGHMVHRPDTLKLDKGIAPALITLLSCIATFTVDFFPHQLAKRI